ncbi:MAG TPA: YetF domain-containing protein [Chloroflexota bacterium]|nr:YetF domain-containing protein [Chloroflexota bacterium]
MLGEWLAAVFSHPDLLGALAIAAKTTVVYVFLVVGLHLLGKRELGQMTIYDLVLIIVLANSVQNAMVGNDTSLLGGLVAAITLLVINRLFTYFIVNYPGLAREMVGQPVLIAKDGQAFPDQLKREGISEEQLMAALREHGITSLKDAKMAVLEVDGSISIVPKEATIHRTRRHFRALHLT